MPISHHYKCLFIHIPKTAGTSIEKTLDIYGDWRKENREILFGRIESGELKNIGLKTDFLQHVTIAEAQEISCIPQDYFSFSFIRNPWDRMVSIYSNPDNNLVWKARRMGIDLLDLSFEEFVLEIGRINHVHLTEQYKFICDEQYRLQVDFLGRFENLLEDYSIICEKVGLNTQFTHANKSEHLSYKNYYNANTKRIIEDRYEADIELFKYCF